MRSFLLLSLFVLVSTIGCNSSSHKTIDYGMGQKFGILVDEQEVPVSNDRVKVYEMICTNEEISLPINRIVEAKNYGIYISYADSLLNPEAYSTLLQKNSDTKVVATRKTMFNKAPVYVLLLNTKGIAVTQYWMKAKALGMQEVFSLVTRDSALASTTYSTDSFLFNRLEQ